MDDRFVLVRDVTRKECHWLPRDFKKGEVLYRFQGATYGVCSPSGVPMMLAPDALPFYEFPEDSLFGSKG